MKYQVKVTEKGMSHILPATMTKEDAEWEIGMQKRLDKMDNTLNKTYEIIEA